MLLIPVKPSRPRPSPMNSLLKALLIPRHLSLLTLAVMTGAIAPISLPIDSAPAIAGTIKLRLPRPPYRGVAGHRRGVASRGGCETVTQPVTALAPEYASELSPAELNTVPEKTGPAPQVWGITAADRPTFWFYIPYSKNSIQAIAFMLWDESHPPTQPRYRTTLAPRPSGIIGITLPPEIAPLQASKTYRWILKLTMNCTVAQSIFVEGQVQRQLLSQPLSHQLTQATAPDKVALYAENGFWYDAVTALAELRRSQPQDADLIENWTTLLDAVGLKNLAHQPLIP
jgi:hypothetical protein